MPANPRFERASESRDIDATKKKLKTGFKIFFLWYNFDSTMEMAVREFGWAWVSEHYTSVGSFFIPFFLRAIVRIHIFTIVELS